jgi:hypothetical protein
LIDDVFNLQPTKKIIINITKPLQMHDDAHQLHFEVDFFPLLDNFNQANACLITLLDISNTRILQQKIKELEKDLQKYEQELKVYQEELDRFNKNKNLDN